MAENTQERILIDLKNMEDFSKELVEKYAGKSELTAAANRVKALEDAGAQANVLEGVKVNGALLTLTEKVADILISEGAANGTIAVNSMDVAVKGLAALAFKAQVSMDELADALKSAVNRGKSAADTVDTLTGTGDGSISKMIDAAFNKFATDVSDDNVVNSYKELIDWAASHGAEAAELAGGISANETAINGLKALVGTLPEGAASTTVVDYIAEAITAIGIGDYAKATEVNAAISTALANHYTKTEADAKFAQCVKTSEIRTATEAEIKALFTASPAGGGDA